MSTTYMDLTLPTPSISVGPAWASTVNTAFEVIDAHDHSSGKGTKVKPNGMDINDDLDIQENELLNVDAAQLVDQDATLTGATNTFKLFAYEGDLYYTNSAGVAVQITDAGTIASNPGSAQVFETVAVSSNLTIGPSDTYVYLIVDCSVARTITLPLASGVTAGRIYIIKDSTGQCQTNNITVARQGSDTIDGSSSFTIDMTYGTFYFICDGSSKYYVS